VEENAADHGGEAYRVYDARGIGQALRHFRQLRGMTQAELADQAGIPRQYLVAMEGGLETEQVRRTFRALRALGLGITVQPRPRR
jgi:HTH-type transcriptional regulator / antitoxin HipB